MANIIRLIDRTRTVQDWKCKRSRWWGYEYLGRGIVKDSNSLELFMGITIHDATAAIATLTKAGEDVDIITICATAYAQMFNELIKDANGMVELEDFAREQATLTEGLVYGFYKHVWPRLMAQYQTIVAVEAEMSYDLADGFRFMTKPDLLVEDSDGELVYIEYKSTSSKKDAWINSWDTAVQLHSSIRATERTLNRTVKGVQIVGLYKGYESYGKQSSPFCYAYKKSGNPPFTKDQIEYKYKAGYRRVPTWELPTGVTGWIDAMPESVLADQFPMTPVIFVNDSLVESFFRQRLSREQEIADKLKHMELYPDDTESVMDRVFPQSFDQCVPSFGWSCQYRKLCHGYEPDPLNAGFVLREPHHAEERTQLGLDNAIEDVVN